MKHFSDDEYDGVIIRLSELDHVEFFGRGKIRVGAGYSLMKLWILAEWSGSIC